MSKWVKIGEFSVDSGTFMICDPCYLETKANVKQIETARKQMIEEKQNNGSINFPNQMENVGLAFIADTLVGDGQFYVFGRVRNDGAKEIKIVFE